MTRPLAALTGATGFLGRRLVAALDQAGWRVRALVRPGRERTPFDGVETLTVSGDLGDDRALAELVDGAAVIVHSAGLVRAKSVDEYMRANRDGARRLAEIAAADAPDAHFLLISSLAARMPAISPYAASKAAGEAAVSEVLPPSRLTIVRPPAIYGPGDAETGRIIDTAAKTGIAPLGPADARIAMIHVADAAAQIAALAGRPAAGKTFALADAYPEGYRWEDLRRALSAAFGRDVRGVPQGLWLPVVEMVSAIQRLVGLDPLLALGKGGELRHSDWSVGLDELATDMPPPRFGLGDGIADAARAHLPGAAADELFNS